MAPSPIVEAKAAKEAKRNRLIIVKRFEVGRWVLYSSSSATLAYDRLATGGVGGQNFR